MGHVSDRTIDDVLHLPVEARIELVEILLASLNPPLDPEIERSWAEEAERRIDQIDRGEVELIPADEVFRKLRERYGA